MKFWLFPVLLAPLVAVAQGVMPIEFPADATTPNAGELRARLAGKAFKAKLSSGIGWRLDYKENGYAFVNVSSGFADKGQWRVEDGKLCSDWNKAQSGCSDVRLHGDSVYVKRSSTGEVVRLEVD